MQEIITRAAAAAEEYLQVSGPVLASQVWVQAALKIAQALQSDTATTDALIEEAAGFRPEDKHFAYRAQLQFVRLARARRAGR